MRLMQIYQIFDLQDEYKIRTVNHKTACTIMKFMVPQYHINNGLSNNSRRRKRTGFKFRRHVGK